MLRLRAARRDFSLALRADGVAGAAPQGYGRHRLNSGRRMPIDGRWREAATRFGKAKPPAAVTRVAFAASVEQDFVKCPKRTRKANGHRTP
jgi:hypothetical protein